MSEGVLLVNPKDAIVICSSICLPVSPSILNFKKWQGLSPNRCTVANQMWPFMRQILFWLYSLQSWLNCKNGGTDKVRITHTIRRIGRTEFQMTEISHIMVNT